MHKHYALSLDPPLISDPGACSSQLNAAALRANLAAHAAANPSIVVGGTKAEMAARLRALLERREADLRVREMLWGARWGDDSMVTEQ
jgi:hypothetical protein